MSASFNKAILLGTLGRDVESKFTPSGTNICKFSMATNSRRKVGDEWKEETEWHNIVLFKGENVAQYLVKGTQVLVEGRIQTRTWDQDGVKHYMTEIIADRVQLVGGKRSEGQSATASAAPASFSKPASAPAAAAAPSYISDDDIPF